MMKRKEKGNLSRQVLGHPFIDFLVLVLPQEESLTNLRRIGLDRFNPTSYL
jgi:hypothetical protein